MVVTPCYPVHLTNLAYIVHSGHAHRGTGGACRACSKDAWCSCPAWKFFPCPVTAKCQLLDVLHSLAKLASCCSYYKGEATSVWLPVVSKSPKCNLIGFLIGLAIRVSLHVGRSYSSSSFSALIQIVTNNYLEFWLRYASLLEQAEAGVELLPCRQIQEHAIFDNVCIPFNVQCVDKRLNKCLEDYSVHHAQHVALSSVLGALIANVQSKLITCHFHLNSTR